MMTDIERDDWTERLAKPLRDHYDPVRNEPIPERRATSSNSSGESPPRHTVQEINWSPAPASLPAGAQMAVLYGDASKDGLFAIRLKVPKGYRVPPHSHPKPEVATVLSGTARLGMGETADADKTHVFPAGSFYATPAGMVHHFSADEDTVVQINSIGPWGITYVNAKDDPRQK
jgi:quercetin dioxygenase-like cupin family protein